MKLLENGFEIIENFISEEWLKVILDELETSEISKDMSGVRSINKKLNSVDKYLRSSEFKQSASPFTPPNTRLVRAILFNKSPESNWYVTWHQDKTVAVSEQFEAAGWRTWSIKENTHHVQPPVEVLQSMVTIRIHLDAASKENGCLKVIPNSHKLSVLTAEEITTVVAAEEPYFCEAKTRAALIMRPHLLHASSKSTSPANRRVLHFEFSDWQLPVGVQWG